MKSLVACELLLFVSSLGANLYICSNVGYLSRTLEFALSDLQSKVTEGWSFCAFACGPKDRDGELHSFLYVLPFHNLSHSRTQRFPPTLASVDCRAMGTPMGAPEYCGESYDKFSSTFGELCLLAQSKAIHFTTSVIMLTCSISREKTRNAP